MPISEQSKRISIIIMLGLLTASAFFIRIENFKHTPARSIDEIVYYRLGKQIKHDFRDYNTIPYGKELMASGRPLPEYFTQPLFRHPPLFSMLIAASLSIFGERLISAEYVSLLMGVLTIPLVYLLGRLLYDRKTGLLAAALFWIDPINIICSQKVWMETTIAFFSVLSVLFFVWGLKKNLDVLFVLSGIASGLAAVTKYTGILITGAIFLYAFFYQRALFSNRKFIIGLFMPFVVLFPWFLWNYKVYGADTFYVQAKLHSEIIKLYAQFSGNVQLPQVLFLAACVLFIGLGIKKSGLMKNRIKTAEGKPSNIAGKVIIACLLFLVFPQIIHSLQFYHLPSHSWRSGMFRTESPVFYFGRLIEFSAMYAFAFIGLFYSGGDETKEVRALRMATVIILAFFIVWRNYQSRYILTCTPLLLVLASHQICAFLEKLTDEDRFMSRMLGKLLVVVLVVLILAKYYFITVYLSFPNDLCYF